MVTKRTINAYTKRARASQSARKQNQTSRKVQSTNQHKDSVAMQVKISGCQRTPKRGSDIKETQTQWTNSLAADTQSVPKQRKTNRQHVGKRLGTGGANVVASKVDARNRCVDLQRHAGNATVSMVTGGETSRNRQDQCADSAAVRGQSNQNRGQTTNKSHNPCGSMSTKRTTTCTQTGSNIKENSINESTRPQRRNANGKCIKTSSWDEQRLRTPPTKQTKTPRCARVPSKLHRAKRLLRIRCCYN